MVDHGGRQRAIYNTSYQVRVPSAWLIVAHSDLDHLLESWSSGFSTVKLLFLLCILCSLEESHQRSPLNWRIGELHTPSFMVEYLNNYFEILLHGEGTSSPSTYFLNHLLVSGWIHGYYLYFGLWSNAVYFVVQSVSALVSESSSCWCLCPFSTVSLLGGTFYFFVLLLALLYFLAL